MCNNNNDTLINIYYLIYKLKKSEIFWIVTTSNILYKLKTSIKKFCSDTEQYYIVSKKIPVSQTHFYIKQFTIFYPDETCKVLYETKLI